MSDHPPPSLPLSSMPWPQRRRWLQGAGAVSLAAVLPGCSWENNDDDDSATWQPAISWGRQAIRDAMASSGTPAVSVALLTPDGVVWEEAFGVMARGSTTAVTTQTRFNIGSVSKVFAAMAIVLLRDRGLVDLDAPVVRYLPNWRMRDAGYTQMTVRHLLSHSSGLPGTNGRNIFTFTPVPGYAADTAASFAFSGLKHAPGELAVYCNDGFTMVEEVVAAVTGRPFAEFVQEDILAPLGMTRSGYSLAPFTPGSFALASDANRVYGQEFVMAYATGGLASTPGDMLRLARMFLGQGQIDGRRVLSADAVAAMGMDQTGNLRINPCPEWRWGLGWDSVRQPGMDAVGELCWQKNGGTAFFATDFFVLPGAGIALCITGNGTTYGAGPLAEGILLRALHGQGRLRQLPATRAAQATAPAVASATGSGAALPGIYGSYEAPRQVVQRAGGAVDILVWQEGAWVPEVTGLRYRTDGWWWPDAATTAANAGGQSYRWQTVEGHDYLILRRPGGAGHYTFTMTLGERMTPLTTPLPAAWQARRGTRWVMANESPDSVQSELGDTHTTLDVLPDLPGYLLWDGRQLVRPDGANLARMTVKVPVNHGRDLSDLVVEQQGGETWLRLGGLRYRQSYA